MRTFTWMLCAALLSSCGKEEPAPLSTPAPAAAVKGTPADVNKLAGDLPKMDPEKAKFIAVPATPLDPRPAEEVQKAAVPVAVPSQAK